MRDLILHIGNHKTGTTAIQTWMHANRAELARQGILDLHVNDEAHVHAHLGYRDDRAVFPKGFGLRDGETLVQRLLALPADRVIASSENFSFFVQQEAVDELARVLTPHFGRIRILAYLRRQDRQANSHHVEGARPDRLPEWTLWGQALGPLPEPDPLQRLYLDYDARLSLWERAFGPEALQVRVYEPGRLVGASVLTDFAAAVGIDTTACTGKAHPNGSLDRVKARVGQIMNQMSSDTALLDRLRLASPNQGPPPRPTQAEAMAFLAPYRESNRRLNARLGLTDLPDLFDDAVDDLPTTPQTSWSDDEMNRVIMVLGEVMLTEIGRQRDRIAQLEATRGLRFADLLAAVQALEPTEPSRAARLVEALLKMRPRSRTVLALKERLRPARRR